MHTLLRLGNMTAFSSLTRITERVYARVKREDVALRMIASLPASVVDPGLRDVAVTTHEALTVLPLPKHCYEVGGAFDLLRVGPSRAGSRRALFTGV